MDAANQPTMLQLTAWHGDPEQADELLASAQASEEQNLPLVIGAAAVPAEPNGGSSRQRLFLVQPLGIRVDERGSLLSDMSSAACIASTSPSNLPETSGAGKAGAALSETLQPTTTAPTLASPRKKLQHNALASHAESSLGAAAPRALASDLPLALPGLHMQERSPAFRSSSYDLARLHDSLHHQPNPAHHRLSLPYHHATAPEASQLSSAPSAPNPRSPHINLDLAYSSSPAATSVGPSATPPHSSPCPPPHSSDSLSNLGLAGTGAPAPSVGAVDVSSGPNSAPVAAAAAVYNSWVFGAEMLPQQGGREEPAGPLPAQHMATTLGLDGVAAALEVPDCGTLDPPASLWSGLRALPAPLASLQQQQQRTLRMPLSPSLALSLQGSLPQSLPSPSVLSQSQQPAPMLSPSLQAHSLSLPLQAHAQLPSLLAHSSPPVTSLSPLAQPLQSSSPSYRELQQPPTRRSSTWADGCEEVWRAAFGEPVPGEQPQGQFGSRPSLPGLTYGGSEGLLRGSPRAAGWLGRPATPGTPSMLGKHPAGDDSPSLR